MKVHYSRILLSLIALVSCAGFAFAVNGQEQRPNVLLIVSDDQGYHDLGILGNGIITPHLDRLASEGVRLTNFYAAWCACTPSRAALLTGRYPQRNGISDMIRNEAPDYGKKYSAAEYEATFERIGGMDLREKIIPEYLKPAGYRSAIYGKWDLGSLRRFLPTSRGFDDFYGFVNTGIDYYTHQRYGVPSMYRNTAKTEKDKGVYCTELFEREALRFLESNAGRPFFLYVPFNAPHGSSALQPEIRSTVQAPDQFKAMYPPVEKEYRTVARFRYAENAKVVTKEARVRDYRAAVTCMDASIGKMLDLLEKRGTLDNTIVIFFSDNGGSGGADNGLLRGGKGTMWEGGIRVLCLVRWPKGGVPSGAVNDSFLSALDIWPSLASAVGVDLPEDVTSDGFNWWPALCDGAPSPRKEMFWQRKDTFGARVGKWKWTEMKGKGSGFFVLESDLGEKNDLSSTRQDELEMVRGRYRNWLQEMERAEPRGPFRDY